MILQNTSKRVVGIILNNVPASNICLPDFIVRLLLAAVNISGLSVTSTKYTYPSESSSASRVFHIVAALEINNKISNM